MAVSLDPPSLPPPRAREITSRVLLSAGDLFPTIRAGTDERMMNWKDGVIEPPQSSESSWLAG